MPSNKGQSWFFLLCALEGGFAAATLFLIPSEGGTLSPARLVLIAIPVAAAAVLIVASVRRPDSLMKLARPGVILLLALLSLVFGLLLFLLRYLDPPRLLSAYERLGPLLWYFLAVCLQGTFYLLYLDRGLEPGNISFRKPVYSYALLAFGLLLFLFVLVSATRLGLTFDPAYWGEPGVPLLGWQFGLALIGGLLVLCLGLYAPARVLDIALPLGIYLLMLGICLSVPVDVLRNSFYMPFASPDLQPFPYSDSAYYDQMAQSVLIGHPYQGAIPTRPLYISFLVVLHLLFGQDYSDILIGQTIVLALIPVLLYFLGKILHSRTAGATVALFFIFRELTSLLISSDTRVTNTKMLLVDLPTLLLLLLACLFAFRWLERRGWLNALAAGGMFGVLLLLRTQSMLIVPFILLTALLVMGWRSRSLYREASIFVLGLAITILPWLIHNYRLTGEFAFDAAFQTRLVASLYAYQGNAAVQSLDVEELGLGRFVIEAALRDPGHVFGFVANHFLATQVNGLLALPLIEPYNGLREPVNLYWMDWDGRLAGHNVLLLIAYLAVISLGLGAAWKRWRWLGLLPLAFSLGYTLSTAVSRYSSWRYDYPADWIAYFYFGIGFAELLGQGALLFGAGKESVFPSSSPAETPSPGPSRVKGLGLVLAFLLVGASPWMIKNIASPRYPDQSPGVLVSQVALLPNAPAADEVTGFTSHPSSFFQAGRLLYPRFFRRNNGLSSANPSPAYAVRDYPRLGFVLLNQDQTLAVFPTRDLPGPIPHGADAVVLGCRREDYVEVRLIALPDWNAVYTSALLSEPCPE